MKFNFTSSVAIALCCLPALVSPACIWRTDKAAAAPPASAPKPVPPAPPRVETASAMPVSIPQTQVTLPSPQPIHPSALPAEKPEFPEPEPPVPPARPPRSPAARTEPRQPATVQPPPSAPPPPASRRRIRPVESAEERGRLMAEISARQRKVQDTLAKVKARLAPDVDKSDLERIQAFLDQTDAALKEQDFQQADALSNRALLLSQDLDGEK